MNEIWVEVAHRRNHVRRTMLRRCRPSKPISPVAQEPGPVVHRHAIDPRRRIREDPYFWVRVVEVAIPSIKSTVEYARPLVAQTRRERGAVAAPHPAPKLPEHHDNDDNQEDKA